MAVLLSVRPKWCELIASGKKTVEVRKTKPKIEPPFKCYIYCILPPKEELFTLGGFREYANELIRLQDGRIVYDYGMRLCCDSENRPYSQDNFLCKKVIGEFVCAETECFTADYRSDEKQTARIAKQACLGIAELIDYQDEFPCLYGWHISDLVIYDKPKELNEFYLKKKCNSCKRSGYESSACIYDEDCIVPAVITRPPRSWCYVQDLEG